MLPGKNKKSIDETFFREYSDRIQDRLNSIDERLDRKTTKLESESMDSYENIKLISLDVTEYQDKLNSKKEELEEDLRDIEESRQNLSNELKSSFSVIGEINDFYEAASSKLKVITEKECISEEYSSEIHEKIEKINTYLEESAYSSEKLREIEECLDESKSKKSEINDFHEHIKRKVSEIDELHRKVLGFDTVDEDGDNVHIDGLKDQLEKSYHELRKNVANLDQQIQDNENDIFKKYDQQLKLKQESYDEMFNLTKKKIESITETIQALLPGAAAAGLSSAFDEKMREEVLAKEKTEKIFIVCIVFLVLISFLPMFFGFHFLQSVQFKFSASIIKDMLSIVPLVTPIYLPIVWLAMSANKKINLSKRLIEEYTHKSTLGKTFDGFSNQINQVQGSDNVQQDLRISLLQNLLQASSENPGKLISNYDKSDHPLMEALDNSVKLANSLTHLAKLPGFSSFAKKVAEKSEKIIADTDEKVKKGLDFNDSLDSKEKES